MQDAGADQDGWHAAQELRAVLASANPIERLNALNNEGMTRRQASLYMVDAACFKRLGPGTDFALLVAWQWFKSNDEEAGGEEDGALPVPASRLIWAWVRYQDFVGTNQQDTLVGLLANLGWRAQDMQECWLDSTPSQVYPIREVCTAPAPQKAVTGVAGMEMEVEMDVDTHLTPDIMELLDIVEKGSTT